MELSPGGVASLDSLGHDVDIGGTLHHQPKTMQMFTRTLALYVIGGAVLVNIAGNMADCTAKGMERARIDRIEKLCQVNPIYCD